MLSGNIRKSKRWRLRCCGVEEWELPVSAEEEMIPEMRLEGWKGVIQGKRRSKSRAWAEHRLGSRTHSVHIRRADTPPAQLPFPVNCSFDLPVGQREHRGKARMRHTLPEQQSLKQALSYGHIPSSYWSGVVMPHSLWDLSSPTRDQAHAPCSGRNS